jgi:hypothetical protein
MTSVDNFESRGRDAKPTRTELQTAFKAAYKRFLGKETSESVAYTESDAVILVSMIRQLIVE